MLVHEAFDGGTLEERVAGQLHLSAASFEELLRALLELLARLHELVTPVLHRDIKPSNIWFSEAQLTADRAALVLCQDLRVAARLIEDTPQQLGVPSAGARIERLVQLCLSAEYRTLRRLLGLSADTGR